MTQRHYLKNTSTKPLEIKAVFILSMVLTFFLHSCATNWTMAITYGHLNNSEFIESLANWQKDKIKMKRISPFVREYTTTVQNHVEVQFSTDGKELNWVSLGGVGNRSNYPMMVSPKNGGTYTFEIVENKPF